MYEKYVEFFNDEKSGELQPHDFHYQLPQILKVLCETIFFIRITKDSFSQLGVLS